jgi:hypothetical protein
VAIDTSLKRRSIVHVGSPWRSVLPRPDGVYTSRDRYTLAGLYSGLVAAVPVQVETIGNIAAAFDSGTHEYDLTAYFSGQTSYSIDPALETGWSFDTDTGVLTIDTDDDGTFGPYTVTATNATGSVESNAFTVKVSASTVSPYGGLTVRSPFRIGF